FVKYGASNSTYRADVVVSGNNTPTIPFPWEASAVNCFITEKSAVNAPACTCGTDTADDPPPPLDELDPDEPHAAATATPTTPTAARSRLDERPIIVLLPPIK